MGRDAIADELDAFWVSLLGGVLSTDWSATPDPNYRFPLNTPQCDPMLNGPFGDLRGKKAVDVDVNFNKSSVDLDVIGTDGVNAFNCFMWKERLPHSGFFSVRPMQNGGLIAFLSITNRFDYEELNQTFYNTAYNNLIAYSLRPTPSPTPTPSSSPLGCGPATYNAGGRCFPCYSTCGSCSGPGADKCTTCASPLFFEQGLCLQQCGLGYFLLPSSNICALCSSDCQSCSGPSSDQCLSCYHNRRLEGTKCV